MKVRLEFNLPEEREDFENAVLATKVFAALWQYDQYLRDEYKYRNNEVAHEIRQMFHEILEDHGISIEGELMKQITPWWKRLFSKWLVRKFHFAKRKKTIRKMMEQDQVNGLYRTKEGYNT